MKILVKLGGTLLDHEDTRRSVSAQLRGLHRDNPDLVVVHGGGWLKGECVSSSSMTPTIT